MRRNYLLYKKILKLNVFIQICNYFKEPKFDELEWKKFSPQCKNFITLLLKKDPKSRPSAE